MQSVTRIFTLLLASTAAIASTVGDVHASSNRTVPSELFAELEELSRLVAISYCVGYQGIQKPFSCLSHCDEFPGLELVQSWDTGLITNSCGYVALSHAPAYPPRILVVFRGTSSISNFLSDLQTSHAEYIPYTTSHGRQCTNCTVHSGFMRGWNATREMILPQLKLLRAEYPSYPIVLTGHSMGGAVAGIAGLELKGEESFWGDVKVASFGEPMFGNAGMAMFVDETFGCNGTTAARPGCTYRRVTHTGDPVPLMPPQEWGWRPHGSEIFISKSDLPPEQQDLVLCSGSQDPLCITGGTDSAEHTDNSRAYAKQQPLVAQVPKAGAVAARGLFDVPPRWKVWQLLFAHREYIWRLGLCFDPDWPWDSNPAIAHLDDNES